MDAVNRRGFLLGGHWIVDVNKRIDHWPDPETLVTVDQVCQTNGGAAFNLACDLACLLPGTPMRAMGLIGADAPGQWLTARCRKLGVDVSGLHADPAVNTATTDVMTEKETGRRTFFFTPGASSLTDASHFDLSGAPEHIFFLGYLGLLEKLDTLDAAGRNVASRLLEQASAQGMLTASDLVSSPNHRLAEQLVPCLPHLDILFANEWEASRVMGAPVETGKAIDLSRAEELAAGILERGVHQAVVLHFARGAIAVTRDEGTLTQGAVCVPPEEIAGTVGAGDAFAAGYLTGVHEGMPPADCLELAVCAAAVSLRDITCSDALIPWQDCLAFGRHHGFHTP